MPRSKHDRSCSARPVAPAGKGVGMLPTNTSDLHTVDSRQVERNQFREASDALPATDRGEAGHSAPRSGRIPPASQVRAAPLQSPCPRPESAPRHRSFARAARKAHRGLAAVSWSIARRPSFCGQIDAVETSHPIWV